MTAAAQVAAAQVERFRAAIARRLGLAFDDGKLGALAETLRRRLDDTGRDIDDYLALVDGDGGAELAAIGAELTVPETYFFRGHEQLRALVEAVVPDRLRAGSRPVRILSAGCATGEEPYTIAMLLRDAGGDATIRGVDISAAALARAAVATYSTWSLRETSPAQRERWFRAGAGGFALDDTIRGAVRFDRVNLAEDHALLAPSSYDVVFCRNVAMYFAPDAMAALIARLTRALAPGGYLFLGYAETLRGLSHDFHLHHTHGAFYYQRKDALAAPRPVAPPAAVAALTAAVDHNDSWVDAIRDAGQRIRALADHARARAPIATPAARDLAVPLDLLRRERFADALVALDELPDAVDADALLLRAILLIQDGRLAAAEDACRRLLADDELAAGAHYVLALCREAAGDRAGAVHHDQLAVHLDAGFAMPSLHLGLLARRAGELDAARRDLGRAQLLLHREDASRLLLFGGGFDRGALLALCRAELAACGASR